MKKRNQIDSALLNDILRVTNQAKPQPILSIQSVIDEFQRFNMAKGLSEWTISFYAKETKAFIRSLVALEIDSENIAKITTDDIQRFVEYQFELKRARTTINSRLRAIKTMFQYAVTKNHIPINPATAIPNVRVRHVVGDMFSRSQLNQLMKQPDISTTVGVRDYTIMMMFAHSGIRLSELAAIRTQDVYFEDNYFIVQRAKNTYARRIPLTKQLRATLQIWFRVRQTMGNVSTDALYITENGTALSIRQIQYDVKKYGERADIAKDVQCSPHVFRRYFIKEKVRAGVDVFTIMALVGHSDVSVLKKYVQIFSSDLDDAIERGVNE